MGSMDTLAPAARPGGGRAGARRLIESVWAAVVADGAEWGISSRAAALLVVLPIASAIGLLAIAPDLPLYTFVTAEDSILEWPQFFTLVVAVAVFLALAVDARKLRVRWLAWGGGAAALLAFFVAGEEISWGQRIFGLATPASLAAINHQDEITLHNIGAAQAAFGYAELITGLVGCLLPLVVFAWRSKGRPALLPTLLVPPLALVVPFALPAAYRLSRVLVLLTPHFRVVKYGELPELWLYLGLAITGWLILRRLRSDPTASAWPRRP